MKNIEIKKIINLIKFQLKVVRKSIVGWSVAIFLIMFLYMILFPSVQDMAQVKLETMPDAVLQMVGMDSMEDMSNYNTYFSIIFNLVLIAVSIFAGSIGTNIVIKEEKNKTIEYISGLNVSREEIYISKIITAFFAIIVVLFSCALADLICGFAVGGETFVLMDNITIVKMSGFIPFFFMAVGLLVAGKFPKIATSFVPSMAVMGTYILGYLSSLIGEKGEWLRFLSPFEMLSGEGVISLETETLIAFLVYGSLMMIFILIGFLGYRTRDL